MMSLINLELMNKIEIALTFDFKNGFKPLKNLIEQRKMIAKKLKYQIATKELEGYFNSINKEIKKYLGL